MEMILAIKDALKKLPNSKEIWIHPDDEKLAGTELYDLGLKVRVLLIVEKGGFVLSEQDIDEVISKEMQDNKISF
jgi:hypothetical protein